MASDETSTMTISLLGGGPYGFRMIEGGEEHRNLLVVDKIRKRGKADENGLEEGDLVCSINDNDCRGLNVASAMQLVDSAGDNLKLRVIRRKNTNSATAGNDVTQPTSQSRSCDFTNINRSTAVSNNYSTSHSHITSSTASVTASSGMTITAPAGVHVEQNSDQSLTMTIGMPFSFGAPTESGNVASTSNQPRMKTTVEVPVASHKPISSGFDQSAFQASQQKVAPVVRTPMLQKVLSEGSEDQPPTPDTPGAATRNKKVFVDSAFYDDPKHRYPTVEEQISLARRVAMSVLAPANAKSRGHKMFVKRKVRAIRWTTGVTDEELASAANEDEESAAMHAEAATISSSSDGGVGGLPSSVVFASRLPTGAGDNKSRMDAMSMEEIDRMQLASKKTTHTNISPQLCFNLADDLKNMKGKGGRLFAKRQACVNSLGGGDDDEEASGEPDATGGGEGEKVFNQKEHAEQMAKISARHRPPPPGEGGRELPVNRLKEMIDMPKPVMTPWDAAAEYHGAVDRAFEHLNRPELSATGEPSRTTPGRRPMSKAFADSLSATLGGQQMRNPAGRSAADASKSQSTVEGGSVGSGGVTASIEGDTAFTPRGRYQPVKFNPPETSVTSSSTS